MPPVTPAFPRLTAFRSVAPIVAVVVATSGCAAHVLIEPPPPATAPVEMRTTYYEEHAPAPVERGELEPRTRLGATHATFVRKTMHLKNGTRVVWVEDLKPLVDDKSDAAKAIDASLALRDRADTITMGGMVIGTVGIGAGVALMATYLTRDGVGSAKNYGADPLTIGALGALIAGGVGGGAVIAWGMSVKDDELDARTRAFKSLDDSLRQRLALPDPSAPKNATTPSSTSPSTPASPEPASSSPSSAQTTNPSDASTAPATPASSPSTP